MHFLKKNSIDSIIILVRTESDFERAISIGIEAKKKFNPVFIFCGDFSPFYQEGINNNFQKKVFSLNKFKIYNFHDFHIISRFLGKILNFKSYSFTFFKIHKFLIFKFLQFFINKNKIYLINKIFKKIKPKFLFTDQSLDHDDYIFEIFRRKSINLNIKVFLFSHGAAGALHLPFNPFEFNEYKNHYVLACNKFENQMNYDNRILIGDPSSCKHYVEYLNNLNFEEINFYNDKKYRIGFFVGGNIDTSTNGWKIQEEIIIEMSQRNDVAMILKVHPRDEYSSEFRILNNFENLRIVDSETDRSRVSKWANILICSDHCSTIFEPMILGKKVVAVQGKRIPKFKNIPSPISKSSVLTIGSSDQFDLDKIPNANPSDKIINQIAWGENGPINLMEFFFEKIINYEK